MFRSKKDIDRHVSDLFSKIHNENERNLRGFNIARLYFQFKDYETARKYLQNFLSVRDSHPPSYKLMAQIHEACGNIERALYSYKRSLELDANQRDIVLKICELYCQIPVDHETARYWADRADQLFPHNEIVFRLRECLVRSEGEPNRQELENLIANELAAQPKNLGLRVKLLKLYLDTERVKEAYAHAVKVESRKPFPNSIEWYNCLIDIFEAYQEEIDQELNSDFYLYFLTAMDNLSALTLAEPHALCSDNDKKTSMQSCSIDNAASVIHTFDQLLKKVCDLPHTDGPWLYFLNHMKGQLYFRLATLLMKRALKDQGNWKEMCRSAAVLFLIGYSFKPVNLLQEVWFSKMDEKQKIFTGFFQQAALRTSFIGHIIISLCKEDKSVWLQKLKQGVCIMQIQERTYNRLFNSIGQNQNDKDSYFLHDLKFVESSLEFPSVSALQDCDQIAYKICADSLHHLVWLHLHHETKERNEFYKNHLVEIFKGLHYGNSNLSKGSPESLCLLDIESFLYAAVYTSSLSLDHRNAIMGAHGEDTFFCVPPDIASSLCTSEQGVWWKATYDLFTGAIKEKLGEKRRILQRGLEIIRGIGNHGLDVQLVVYLARLLADRAASNVMGSELGKEDNVNKFHSERISQLENRSMHYWNIALGMLEKLEQGQTIRVPKEFLFASYNKNLTIDEITTLKEEGHLYLACREMNSGKLEEAASILSKLSSPFASFYLALTLKKSALQQIEVNPNNGVDAKSWNTRTALLNRAKDSLYTTMDRIKGDENHPLKKELMIEIEDIENEIVKDLESAHVNSPGIGEEEQEHDEIDNSPFSHQNSKCDTPKFSRRLMKQSTPRPSAEFLTPTSRYKNINETKNKRLQPSPERLDVQIRTLALTQDTLVKTVLEQQKALVETNKAVVEELKQNKAVVEDLKKQLEELRISTNKYFTRSSAKKPVALKGQGDDETEDDYGDYDANGCLLDYYIDDNGEMDYGRTAYPFVQPPVVPEPPVAPTISYIHQPPLQPSGPPPPPPLTHYGYQYPPPPPLPPSGPVIAESSQYFHSTPAQGLSFSEGQRLPQFHFHVGSSMVKAPVPNTLGNVPTPLPPPSIIATPPGQQAMKQPVMQPNSPWVKGTAVAHAFQIPLPPSASAASTSTQPPTILSSPAPYITSNVDAQTPVTTSMVCSTVVPASTCGLLKTLLSTPSVVSLPGVPSVAHKNVSPSSNTSNTSREASFLNKSAVTPNPIRTRQNSDVAESVGSETESHDIEKEVMGDFKPLIPLPAEIIVETGEEGENVLFEERAKLFRYVDHEWKERGVGIMKLLHNETTGKVRVLMRRDQVLKVCANHFIVPSMEIHPMKNSDKAWIWAAQDFADETIKPEQFCVKFKTADIGILFKKAFVQAVAIVQLAEDKSAPAVSTAVTTLSLPFGGKFLPKTGSWTCPVCYVSNTSEKLFCAACETPKPLSQQTAAKSLFTVNTSSFPFAVSSNANIPIAVQPVATSPSETSIKIHDSYESDKKTVEAPTPASNLLSHSANKKAIMQLPIGTKATVGGFTFSSTPVIKESISPTVTDREILVVNTKSKNGSYVNKVTENTKSSPFSGFSFKPTLSTTFSFNSPASSNVIQTATENSDNKFNNEDVNKQIVFDANSDVSQLQFTSTNDGISKFSKDSTFQGFSGAGSPLLITVTKDGRRVSGEFNCDGTPEEFEPTTEFKPVVPMPALVEVKTGEEEEEKLFGVRSKLYRYDRDGKEWKERGIGELKILFQKSTGKYRILMRREQVLKLCANHYILPKMKLTPLASSDRAWVWLAQDFSEGYLREEKFAAKFKNPDIAKQFHSVFENCKRNLPISTEEDNEENVIISKAAETSETDEQKSLSAHFKHKLVTWECSVCYAKNDSSKTSCVTCKSVKPVCKPTTKTASSNANESSNNCNDLKKSFADLFKPDVDSWECKCCYVRNNKSVTVCIACESLKTGSNDIPAVPTSATPVSSKIFGFGPQTPATFNDSQNFVFGKSQASTSKPSFTFGSSTTPFTFGHPSLSQQSSDTFGFKPTLNSDNTNRSTAVFGGTTISPPKGITSNNSNFTVPPVTVPPAYVFGGTSSKFMFETSENNKCPSTPVDNSVEFRFGSPQKYEFNFCGVRPRSPSKTPKSPKTPGTPTDIEEEEEVESSDDIYFQPVIPLPPKIDVKTGEENETVLFGKRAKLFRFCSGEWKERGIGDIKILHNMQNETFRLLMRRDQVLKVCLNHYLSSDMKFEPKGDKALSWAATDFSENEPSPELFTVRFKTAEILSEFKNIADVIMRKLNSCDNKDGLKSSSTEILTSPVSVPGQGLESLQKDSFTNKPNDDTRIKPDESSSTAITSIPSRTVNAFNFSFKAEEKKQTPTPAFSLSSRFGGCTPVRELFGRPSDSSGIFSKSTFTFNKPKSSDKDIEVLELKTASEEKREQAEKLKLPSNFYLYENKIPCPGCRGCDNGHVENCGMDDEMQVLYEAVASSEQIAAARDLMLPPTFFLYENKPPCPGCRGCTDEIPEHIGEEHVDDHDDDDKMSLKVEVSPSEVTEKEGSVSQGMPFSNSESTFSFADITAKGSGFEALSKTAPNTILCSGAGAPVFRNLNDSKASEGGDDDAFSAPDIHFEPVIPLPELVEVKTGEEEETSVFSHRAKLYKYDSLSHQWKERGIGDFKILCHVEKCRYRLLLRREQVHKVACNHCITLDMKLNRLSTSETTLCWNAIDYSDGHPECSQFAVKFKKKEIMEQFQSVFDKSMSILSLNQENCGGDTVGNQIVPDSYASSAVSRSQYSDPITLQNEECQDEKNRIKVTGVGTAPTSQKNGKLPIVFSLESQSDVLLSSQNNQYLKDQTETSSVNPKDKNDVEKEQNELDEQDENTDDDDDGEDNEELVFEKRVTFEVCDDETSNFKVAGLGLLRMLYDDSVFRYRITTTDDQDIVLCDHIIEFQTSLIKEKKTAIWAALDTSINPPKQRQFRATFSSIEAFTEFESLFNMGKQTALRAAIVENSNDSPSKC